MPAHHCDVDHTVAYAEGGATTLQNMGNLCKNHHLLKHHGGWSLEQEDYGEYLIESPTGRSYRTRPASRVRFTAVEADEPDLPGGLDEPDAGTKGTAPPTYSDNGPFPF